MTPIKYYFAFALLLCSNVLFGQWENAVDTLITNDEIQDQLTTQALVSDPVNNLHALYLKEKVDTNGYDIFYDRRTPEGIWNGATLLNAQNEIVYDAALGAVKADSFHVVYVADADSSREIFMTTFQGVTKIERQVTFNTTEEFNPTVEVDNEGWLHMVWVGFNDDGDSKLYYANNAFSDTIIPQPLQFSSPYADDSVPKPSLAIEDNGAAHIAFKTDLTGERIQYIFNQELNNLAWNYHIVDTDNTYDDKAFLAVGDDGQIHMAYSGRDTEGGPDVLNYTWRPPGDIFDWMPSILIDEDQLGSLGSLELDAEGVAHVAINGVNDGEETGDILYATNAGDAWSVEELLANGETFNAQIILDNISQAYAIAELSVDTIPGREILIYGNPFSEVTVPPMDTVPDTTTSIINMVVQNELLLFPNPVQTHLTVTLPLDSEVNSWMIYDVQGKLISTGQSQNQDVLELSFEDYQPGIYVLAIESDGIHYSEKVLVE